MRRFAKRLWRDESGQDIVEYGLLMSFIVLFAVGLLVSSGVQVKQMWSTLNSTIVSALSAAS
jgi:Flp pilus assembly pilin Flp